MDPAELRQLEGQLYNQQPAIGGWLRRLAASAIARSGTPAAVQVLATAVCQSDDERVRAIALNFLRQQTAPPAIDAACAVWAATRHPTLTDLLLDRRWVAAAPPSVRVLSALKTKQMDVVTTSGAEIVKPLLKACRDSDADIADRARRCLGFLLNPEAVDALCAKWARTRSRLLSEAIVNGGYVARQPLLVRVLTALMNGADLEIATAGAEVVEPLLIACRDVDQLIVTSALKTLRQLKQPAAQEELCRWVICRDHPLARTVAIAAKYAPADPFGRSVFYFLTEQWREYEQLDFDQSLLAGVYQGADEKLRSRICKIARRAGRVELVQILSGDRLGLDLRQMTALEWETAIAILREQNRWQEIWDLAQIAPAVWSVKLLQQLNAASWVPPAADRSGWKVLMLLADGCADVSGNNNGVSLQTGRMHCRGVIEARTRQLSCLAISPIGVGANNNTSLLATGREDGRVVLWTIAAGHPMKLAGQQAGLAAVANAGDGGPGGQVCCIAFSPTAFEAQQPLLATGSDDGSVRLWRLKTSFDGINRVITRTQLIGSLEGHTGSVGCLAFSQSAYLPLLATGSADGTVRLWQLPTGEAIATLSGHTGWINCLAITPGGDVLATGSADGTVRLWHLPSGELMQTLTGHAGPVECLAISPNGELLVTGSWDRTVWLWGLPGGESRKALTGHAGSIGCLAISPDGLILATGSNDYKVRLWQLPSGEPMQVLEGHTGSVSCLAFSPTDDLLATGGWDNTVRLWNARTGAPQQRLKGHTDWIMGLAFSPTGELLATGSGDKTVRLWTNELDRLCRLPIAQLKLADLELVQALIADRQTSEDELHWLKFLLALMRWHRRFDVELEAAAAGMTVGEFDVEIEHN